jgi:hypothetical protein
METKTESLPKNLTERGGRARGDRNSDKLISSWGEIKNRYLVLSGITRDFSRVMPAAGRDPRSCARVIAATRGDGQGGGPPGTLIEQRRD